jgi:hypothetical protein
VRTEVRSGTYPSFRWRLRAHQTGR